MKLKHGALLLVWILILSTLSGCFHFSVDYLPDLFFEEDAAESPAAAPSEEPAPTPSPTPETEEQDSAAVPSAAPSSPALTKPSSWATTSTWEAKSAAPAVADLNFTNCSVPLL